MLRIILCLGVTSQARKQEFFRAGEVFCNMGTSVNTSSATYTKEATRRKYFKMTPILSSGVLQSSSKQQRRRT